LPGPVPVGRSGRPARRPRGTAHQGRAMTPFALDRPEAAPWQRPAEYWPAPQAATAGLEPPFRVISLAALAHNAHTMLDRANGTTIRVASKSVRVRQVLDAVLALPGYRGVLAYTLPEALWLAGGGIDDIVVGYPTADRVAITQLAVDPEL